MRTNEGRYSHSRYQAGFAPFRCHTTTAAEPFAEKVASVHLQ
jgi:hypothetical protein